MWYYRTCKDNKEVIAKLRSLAEIYPTRSFDDYYGKIRNDGLVWNRKRVLNIPGYKTRLEAKAQKTITGKNKEPLQQPDTPKKVTVWIW